MKKLFAGVILALAAGAVFAQTAVTQSLNNITNKAETYHSTVQVTLAATPTEFYALAGSATRTVYVKSLEVSCTQTTGAYQKLIVTKRTVGATGGTSATATPTPLDSLNAAPTATVRTWTANPSAQGTGVSLTTKYVAFPGGTMSDTPTYNAFWGSKEDQYVVLRGIAQSIGLNLAGATTTGGVCIVNATWMER